MKDFSLFSRKLARYLLLCLVLSAGCAEQKEADRTLRIGGLGGPPGPINQIISNGTISVNLADLVYSPLVRINARMLPEPALAERWSVSPDGLTYTFYLRKGVRFHDGTELTAQDCAFTYNAVLNPATKSPWRDNYNMIKTVSAENSHTFRVTLKESQASFINLMNFPIHPAHTNQPIGAGPFRFLERTADDCIILEANPDYYEGKPTINRIEARGYDTFPQYFSAFMKGRIDFIQFLSPEQYETISRDPAFRTYRFPSIYTYMIDYNPDHPLFRDKRVRRALAQAINIPEIIRKIDGGLGVQSTGPFLPGAWFSNPDVHPVRSEQGSSGLKAVLPNPSVGAPSGANPRPNIESSANPFGADLDIKPLEYNPAEALRLLKESSGLKAVLPNPSVGAPSGANFILLVDPGERTTEQIARLIYQDLYKIGVRCEIKTYDHFNQDKALIDEAGAAIISFAIPAELEPNWRSNKQQRLGKLWKYVNPEIDALFEQADRTPDLQERTKLYHQLHRRVYAEQSGTFLYNHPNLAAINKRFGNTESFFTAALPFYTIKDWEIK